MAVNDALATEQYYRYRWCAERGHYAFLEKASRCESYFAGDQWNPADLNKLARQGRPALTINKIISTLSTIMGEQIYNRNEVLFRPSTGAEADTAEALSKVWMELAQKNQLPWTRSEVFCDGIIRSRGFYDVRLNFNDSTQGTLDIDLLNSKNVIIDPDAEEYDPDMWNDVFITKWLTPQDIAILYDEADADYLKDRESSSFVYGYDSIEKVRDRFSGPTLHGSYYGIADLGHVRRNIRVIERQYHKLDKRKHFVDVQTGDTHPVPENWDRNRISAVMQKAGSLNIISKQVKRVRWTVTADNVVLHDDWSPYKHFTVVPYFPLFRYGRTIGLVENLISPQELLNKTSSQELHIVNTTANSGWKLKAGALKNMSIEELKSSGSQTGLVLELDDIASAEKISPNQTPSGLDRISYKAEEHIKGISGVSDSMQGFDREDVAAKAIAYKTQRGNVNMTKVLDNLERTDWILARNVLDIIQDYYSEQRLIHITHDDVTRESETIVVNQPNPQSREEYEAQGDDDTPYQEILHDLTLGEYSIVITSTPSRASMEDSQFEQAKALREIGVQIPDAVLIENSRLMRRSEIVKKMEAAQNSPQAQQEAALNMRAMEANVQKLEGEAANSHAKAGLDQARTQAELQQVEGGDGAEMAKLELEQQMAERQFELDKWKMEQEFALKREQMAQELALKREQHQQDMAIKQQMAQQEAEQQRQDHYEKRLQESAQAGKATEKETP